jgi:23S rRNA (adenine2503-C2)-methyltransferase
MDKEKVFLVGKSLSDLQELAKERGWPKFTARQLTEWIYQKNVSSFEEMTNISKKIRQELEQDFEVGLTPHIKVSTSTDGTKKYLYPYGPLKFIETAYIPEESRNTLCVSSQIGCKMGCLFCMTGKQGFQGNLTAGQIVNQVLSLPEREKLTNIVYMGMGEPFDNLKAVMKSVEIFTADWGLGMSPKRITVSTIGIIPAMKEFIENSNAHLAISLHSPFEDERRKLMPIESVYSLPQLIDTLHEYDFGRQRRVSFEYIMFKGLNDQKKHVNQITKLLHGLRARLNLIRFHPIPGTPLEGTDDATIEWFRDELNKKGVKTTIRASRGQDIEAACGLLSTKEMVKMQEPDF